MKKNKMMRIASVLLVAVLLSTCAISGTFAKYATTSTGSDQARVAYWGWKAPATMTIDLFDANYDNNNVNSTTNVVAPGTSKTASFSFRYETNAAAAKPEVAYNFTVSVNTDGSSTELLDDNPNFKWTLDNVYYNTLADLKTAIENLDGNKTYSAGELPTAFDNNQEHTVGWTWIFDETQAPVNWPNDPAVANQDVKDTQLGNTVNGTLENVSITITITATQID